MPSLGGHNAEAGGCQERGGLDDRNDVLTYTTAPLDAALTLAGDVALRLQIGADAPSFDISAVLSRVTADGRVFNLTQGHARIDGAPALVRIELRALCATLPAGEALRLSLSATNFPAFAVNPGTGAAPAEARLIDARIVTLTVTTGVGSYLELPAWA